MRNTQKNQSPDTVKREIRYYLTSLGCPKNLVESEEMMAKMSLSGMVLVNEPEEADLLVVNTCGFINPAKEESIRSIMDLVDLRESDPSKRLVVVGCMVQRYRKEMTAEIPEVDAFIGVEDKSSFIETAWRVFGQEPIHSLDNTYPFAPRLLTTPPHYAYLRISDGCSHRCSYCTIPMMRGKHRSRPMEEIVQEAESLAAGGAKELIVISQDTTSYGFDIYGHTALADLLSRLDRIDGLKWIRLMYTYPHMIDKRLAHVFGQSEKLVSYIDMPIQHGDPEILKLMNRGSSDTHIRKAVALLRGVRRDMVIRTTVMVGFPGEKTHHFDSMRGLLEEMDFDRIGVFPYSKEESTPAAELPDQVSNRIKELIDSPNPDGDGYLGRYFGQAPEVDGQVIIKGTKAKLGTFCPVRIDQADEDNLYGFLNIEERSLVR